MFFSDFLPIFGAPFFERQLTPIIVPFAGLRYDLDVVGSLSDVVAPPYDVIDPDLQEAATSVPAVEATDHLGAKHSMWVVTDAEVLAKVGQWMHDKPMFVADGHHRYETACNYRDYLIERDGRIADDHPANFVMTQLVSMNDPGMIVLPTHRLLRGTPCFSSDQIIERLRPMFDCQKFGSGLDAAFPVWQRMESENRQGLMALWAAGDSQWVLCDAAAGADDAMRRIAPGQSQRWRTLGFSLLHRLVIDDLLGAAGHPKPTYVHQVDEVIQGLSGEGALSENESDEPFPLAALVMPARGSDVEAISLRGERMPAKSTYFSPKLLSGVVFHTLD